MNLRNFVRGIEILRSHYKDGDGYHLGSEHDQIYLYATDTPLSDGELNEMADLGWFQPEVGEDDYDPDESWSVFT